MKITRVSEDKTVKFGDLKPGDVFMNVIRCTEVEVYYMVIKKVFTNPENAVDLETGTLNTLHKEDDVIPFDAELSLKDK